MKLIDILIEDHDFELSEDYPEGFELGEFKNIWSYAGKLRYAKEHLGKPIGSGSARTVYRVDADKVLKLAKNKKGLAQNEQEANWFNDSYYDTLIARVIDFDEKSYLWVEMEVAYRAKKSDFMRLWNVNLDDLRFYLKKRYYENKGQKSPFHVDEELKNQMDENDDVQHLVSFMYDSNSSEGDISKPNSWGLVKRNNEEHLVLIDFGLSDDVYSTYYGRN